MKKISTLLFSFFSMLLFSQFVSPGTGITYNLNSLSLATPTSLVNAGTFYQMNQDITISVGDKLLADENTTLKIAGGKTLTIGGAYDSNVNDFTITAVDSTMVFRGIRFEEGSSAVFKNTKLQFGGGIQVLTTNFLMDGCTVRKFKAGLVTGAAVNFSRGNPVVKNSTFLENDLPAVASGATNTVALEFSNNYLYGNNKSNSNRPQVNMGPSGSGITKILNNTIIGDRSVLRAGGVSVSTLTGAANNVQIEGNIITDNRYGITVVGNISTGVISSNILTNNSTENDPAIGGSGISISGSGAVGPGIKIEKNQFRGNLYGVTVVTTASVDMGGGSLGSVGQNIFANNGNNGQLYALYNNTPNPVSATNNCWREGELSDNAMVENVIFHKVDNANLGTVNFTPYLCATLGTNDISLLQSKIYPNPSNGTFSLIAELAGTVSVTDVTGKVIYSGSVVKGTNAISLKAVKGLYFVNYEAQGKKQSTKLIIK